MSYNQNSTRNGTDTRERIVDEAAKLFYLNGYKKTTMRSLASSVGIKHPSLFAFFENKGAIAAVLLMRYYRGIHQIAKRKCVELGVENDYIGNILVFYAINYLTIYRDERFASFYSSFCEEDHEMVDNVAVSLKLLHESEYTAPKSPQNDTEIMIHELDYRLIGHISNMLVQLLSDKTITARDAAVYFAAKKSEFHDTMWENVTLEDITDFCDKYWDQIADVSIDVYSDLFSNASLD